MGGSGRETWTDETAPADEPRVAAGLRETGVVLGQGGLGRVDLVVDEALDREVARKRVLVDSPAARARFLREARITARLEHPGIVPLYATGTDPDGNPWYTMRRIRGRTLTEVLREAPDLRARLALLGHVVDTCHAVAYAHAEGVVHRDLKPDNVMVGAFGETLVVDWGLARDQEDAAPVGIAGSPSYMSPEQARGDAPTRLDDLWSLGAILFELLTGRPPFDGVPAATTLERLRRGELPAIEEALRRVPPELAAVVRKAMGTDPRHRYADARELARDIVAWQTGARVSVYQYRWWELLLNLARRNPPLTAVLAVSVVGAVVGGVWLWVERDRAVRARREAELHFASAQTALARAAGERGLADEALRRLADVDAIDARYGLDPLAADVVRGWIAHVRPPPVVHLPLPAGSAVVADRELTAVGYGSSTGELRVVEVPTGVESFRRTYDTTPMLAFDGRDPWVVLTGEDGTRAVPLAGGAERRLGVLPPETIVRVVGGRVFAGGPEGLVVFDGEAPRRLVEGPFRLMGASADGSRLLGTLDGSPYHDAGTWSVVDLTGAERLRVQGGRVASLDREGRCVTTVTGNHTVARRCEDGSTASFSAEGVLLAQSSGDGFLLTTDQALEWRGPDGALVRSVPLGLASPAADDERFVISTENGALDVHLVPPPPPAPEPTDTTALVVSADGAVAVATDMESRLRILDPRTGVVLEQRTVPAPIRDLALAPDGRLATADRAGVVEVTDAAGTTTTRWSREGPATAVAFRADGTLAAAWADGTLRRTGAERDWTTPLIPWDLAFVDGGLVVSNRRAEGPAWVWFDETGAELHRSARSGPAFQLAADGPRSFAVATYAGPVLRVTDGAESVWPLAGPVGTLVFARGAFVAEGVYGEATVFARDGAVAGAMPLHTPEGAVLGTAGTAVIWIDGDGRFGRLDLQLRDGPPGHLRAAWALSDRGAPDLAWAELQRAVDAGEWVSWEDRVRLAVAAGRWAEAGEALGEVRSWSPASVARWRSAIRAHAP